MRFFAQECFCGVWFVADSFWDAFDRYHCIDCIRKYIAQALPKASVRKPKGSK